MTFHRRTGLGPLRPAAEMYGDVVTAYVDVSRTHEDAAREVEIRIGNLERDLLAGGTDEDVVAAVVSRLQGPTGHAGEVSRAVVAQSAEPTLDIAVGRALDSRHHVGPVAHLRELADGMADTVTYVLVVTDHTGADITVADSHGLVEQDLVSEGDHDVLHKIKGGGWSHRRFQSRVEDSWDRNAEAVARDLDALVREVDPDVVLVAGDPYASSKVQESVAGHVSERLALLDHGSRADGASDERMQEEVEAAVQRCRTERMDTVLDRLGASGTPSAVGLGETVEALRRGEVETLVLLDGALDGRQGHTGEDPLLLATEPDELAALGVDEVTTDRLDELLVRAAIAQDADLLPLRAPVGVLPDGVGAVLRFSTRPEG